MFDDNEMLESTIYNDLGSDDTNKIKSVNKVSGVSGVEKVNTLTPQTQSTTPTKEYNYKSKQQEDAAQNEAQLQFTTGVERVRDSEEAKEWLSAKQLYEKTLGVTEYDELRAKLNLRSDESFTDYYNRTGYIPKGFEKQAQLLLAEEKRKKLYTEVQQGNMSEEDFLYEAYGKDLLKEEGVDFSSSLYWYNRYKNGDYSDPRKNATYMLQVIENAKTLFEGETWYEASQTQNINDLAQYVTGEVLDVKTVSQLFPEAFEAMSQYYDDQEKIVKYYRAGMLQGFNPTIDVDGDGKIDYYYSTDGKLYNVNETGKGANTVRAVYNDDGSLNRIVFADSYLGEVAGEFLQGIGKFFTGVVDLGALLFGAIVDIFDGGGFGDTVAEYNASMQQFWNSVPVLGEREYIADSGWKTSDGKTNWANIGRQASNLVGYIVPMVALTIATGGGNLAGEAGKKVAAEGTKAAITAGSKATAKAATKSLLAKAISGTWTGVKAAAKYTGKAAVALTKFQYGFGTGWTARLSGAAINAVKDILQTTATLKVNQKQLGLDDGQIVGRSLALGAIDFTAGVVLRSVGDESALKALSKLNKTNLAQGSVDFLAGKTPNLWARIGLNTFSNGWERAGIAAANVAMDSLENVITAAAQTSLTSNTSFGKAIESLFNSPQFVMNMAYQGYNTVGDMYRISPQKVAAAATDALKMDTDFRSYIKDSIAACESENNLDGVNALNKVLQEYDNTVIKYMSEVNDTPVKYKGEDTELSKAYNDLSDDFMKKAEGTESDRKKTGYAHKANDIAQEGRVNYTKAEAILLALEDVTTKMGFDDKHELFVKWGKDAGSAISAYQIAYNDAVFKQIHQDHLAYVKLASSCFMGDALGKFLYGKEAREVQTRLATSIYSYYYSNKELDHYDILDQLNEDMQNQSQLYSKLMTTLDGKGDELLANIKADTMTGDIIQEINKDGSVKVNDNGAVINTPKTNFDTLTDEGKEVYRSYFQTLDEKQKAVADRDILITIPGKGSEAEGTDAFKDATNYLNIATEMFQVMSGEYSPLMKLDEQHYLLRYTSIGKTLMDVQDTGNLIRALTNLKLSVTNQTLDTVSAMKTLIAVFGQKPSDIDTAIEDNTLLIPGLINALKQGNAFTYSDLALVIKDIDEYLVNRQKSILPESQVAFDDYDKARKLKEFIKDYSDLQDNLRATDSHGEITSEQNKAIIKFMDKYSPMNKQGNRTSNDILSIAEKEGLWTNHQMNSLEKARNFIQGKTSTPLAMLRKQSNASSVSENDRVTTDDVVSFFEKQFPDILTFKRKTNNSKSNSMTINIESIGSTEDFNRYLSSLYAGQTINIEDLDDKALINAKEKYINDTIDAIQNNFSLSDNEVDRITEDFEYIFDRNNPNNNYADRIEDIKNIVKKSKYDREKNLNKELVVIQNIDEHTVGLNNHTDMVYLDLNNLVGNEGKKIQNKLNSPESYTALVKADTIEGVERILFGNDSKKKFLFRKELSTIKRLRNEYGSNIISLPKNSKAFESIMSNLGYNANEKINYVNGEVSIPGIYYNSDVKGINLTSDSIKAQGVLSELQHRQNNIEIANLKKSISFRDPIEVLTGTSANLVIIDPDEKLTPKTIIFNTVSDPETFRETVADIIKYNIMETKRGKNAGALFKQLLTSTQGLSASGTTDQRFEKALGLYKIVNAFSKLYRKEGESYDGEPVQVMNISFGNANALKKTFEKATVQPFLFNDNDDLTVRVSLNPEMDSTQFQNLIFKKISNKKSKVYTLAQILPIYGSQDQVQVPDILHNNLTKAERTNIASGYTTLTWLEETESLSLDIYDYISKYGNRLNTGDETDIAGLNLKDNYDKALKYLENKSMNEVINDTSMNDNIFVTMQKNAYIANKAMSETFKQALQQVIPEDKNIDGIFRILTDADARRSFGSAIRKALQDNKESLSLDNGFVNVTPELIKAIKENFNYKKFSALPEQGENYSTDTSRISGIQFASLNQNKQDIQVDDKLIEDMLYILPLEYSSIMNSTSPITLENKLLAMIQSSSAGTTGLNISTKDLYTLSPKELQDLKALLNSQDINTDELEIVMKDLNSSTLYNNLHKERELPIFKEITDIPSPSQKSSTGDIIYKNNFSSLENELKRLLNNANTSESTDIYTKLSNVNNEAYRKNAMLIALAKELGCNVVPYINNSGSLMLANLNIAENVYYLNKNLSTFATALNNYGIKDKDAALNIAYNFYLYSSGMQQQGAHPEFIIVDKASGHVIDIAMSGSAADINDGLITRLYKDYFEINKGELHFKKQFTQTLPSGETITVSPDNLCAIKLQRNALNTTFTDAKFDIDMYDFEGHERQFKNMIMDKVRMVAYANNLDTSNPQDTPRISKAFTEFVNDRENQTIAGFNKSIRNTKANFYKDSFNALTDTVESLDVTSARSTDRELATSLNTTKELKERNIKEQNLNDLIGYGTTNEAILNTNGAQDFLADQNKALSITNELSNDLNTLFDYENEVKKQKALEQASLRLSKKYKKDTKKESARIEKLKQDIENLKDILSSTKDTIEKTKASKQFIINAHSTLVDLINKNQYLDNSGKPTRLTTILLDTLSAITNKSKEELAIDTIKNSIRLDNSTEANAFKLLGCDLDTLKARTLINNIMVGNTAVNITDLSNKPMLVFDTEVFYDKGRSHVYEVSIAYYRNGKLIDKQTKYLKDPTVIDTQTLKNVYPEFYNNYYKNNKGTMDSFNKYLISNGINLKFDQLLSQANSDNAVLLGFNSKNFDTPALLNNGLLSEVDHANLLGNQIDLFDIVKQMPTQENLNLYGGMATLKHIADQFGIDSSEAHFSDADNDMTKQVLDAIINSQVKEYKPKLLTEIEKIYTTITGKDFNPDIIKDAFSTTLKYDNVSQHYNIELGDLVNHLKRVITDPEHFTKMFQAISIANERDINKKIQAQIRNLNTQLALNVSNNQLDFATAYATPSTKNMLLDIVAYNLTKDGKIDNIIDQKNKAQQVFKDLSYKISKESGTDNALYNNLTLNKNNLLNILDVDKEDFYSWRKEHAPETQSIINNAIKIAYDSDLSLNVDKINASNSIAYSVKFISDYTDTFDFLPTEMKTLIKNEITNFYDYKGERKNLSNEIVLDCLSNLDKDIIDYLMTDPLLDHTFQQLYRLAQTVSDKPITLRDGSTEYLKNNTVYMTLDNYCKLLDISTTDEIPDPNNYYIPVIRHPLDKFDSIHYFKVKLIDDNQGIDVAINIDTMLSKLNGDFDGDHITMLRPSDALSIFGKEIDEAGKNSCYNILDDVVEKISKSSSRIKPTENPYDIKETLKINTDNAIKERVKTDLEKLYKDPSQYDTLKANFINDFSKTYSEEALKDSYIVQGIDVSDILYDKDIIFYSNLLSLNDNELNTQAKRAYTIAQMTKYKMLGFTDTQTGMFQKGFLNEDFSNYGNIDLIDNMIRLSGTTKYLVNSIQDLYSVLPDDIKTDPRFTQILSANVDNATKLELILKHKQLDTIQSDSYKTSINNAIKNLKNSTIEDPFVKAFKRFCSGNTEDTFFPTLEKIVSIKKRLRGNSFTTSKDKDYIETLKHIFPSGNKDTNNSVYNPGKEMTVVYDLDAVSKNPEDTTTFIGWKDAKGNHGALNYKAVNATNSDVLPDKVLSSLKNYKQLDVMTEADVKKIGLEYNKNCQYRFVAKQNGIVTVIQSFNIDTAKTMSAGNIASKATPTSTINDLSTIKDPELKTLIENNDVSMIRSLQDTLKGKKATSEFQEFINSKFSSYELYDANHKKTTDINNARYIIAKEKVQLLELPQSWNRYTRDTKFEELAYGNNMLGTGGIGLTYGIFVDSDELGNDNLVIDNSRYNQVKKLLGSLSDYDRYSTDATQLYEHLAVAAIVNNLDETELKGQSKQDYYLKQISGDAQNFIHNHLKMGKDLSGEAAKLINVDTYNKVYGIQPSIINTKNINLRSKSGKDINNKALFYTNTSDLQGNIKDMYHINDAPNMSTVELINLLNNGRALISDTNARKAEQYNLLINKQLPEDSIDYSQYSNTNPKIAQVVQKPIEHRNAVNAIPNMFDTGTYEDYYTNFKFDGNTSDILGQRLSAIYGNDMFKSRDDRFKSSISTRSMRMANIISSLLNANGTFKDRDMIIEAMNPNIKALLSMSVPMYEAQADGSVRLNQRRIALGPDGYKEVPISKIRTEIYNQRRSPYYWDTLNDLTDKTSSQMDYFLTKHSDGRQLLTPSEVTLSKDVLNELRNNLSPDLFNQKYLEQINNYSEQLKGIYNSTLEDNYATKYSGEFISGDNVENKLFKEQKLGLNNGLALQNAESLKQDRNIRQVAVDEQYTKQYFNSQLGMISMIAQRENCTEFMRLFSYVVGLQTKLDSLTNDKSSSGNITKLDIQQRLESIGIPNGKQFIKDFESQHYSLASKFYSLVSDLNTSASKYSQATNEPSGNIFFLLLPDTESIKGDDTRKKYVVNMLAKTKETDRTTIPAYDTYDVFTSLETTINNVSKRSAIYNNAVRLKQDGVIDSIKLQNIIADAFNDEQLMNKVNNIKLSNYAANSDQRSNDGTTPLTTFEFICSKIIDTFPESEIQSKVEDAMNMVFNNQSTKEGFSIGAGYMKVLEALSDLTSNFKSSLDDTLELANQNATQDVDNIIYAYRQMQDIYAQLCSFDSTIGQQIFTKINNYATEKGLALVDKYGRKYDPNMTYRLDNTSLEYLPKYLDRSMSSYDNYIISQTLVGNVFFMDKNLANVFADQVFVKTNPNKLQKVLQKSAGWCVKMLMSSPLKLIDRFAKFTLFDMATLSSANHETLFNQGQAYKDLRAYFASQGGYSSPDLNEFLKTQGVALDGSNFDGLISGDIDAQTPSMFKQYTDKVGNAFTFQTLSQRYAYWLATKKAIEKGDYSTLGSSYHLMKQMQDSGMTPGEQASFAVAQNLGSVNDFPSISKRFNRNGFVFTTFPLAAVRWGIGELRSAGAAVQSLFSEGLRGSGAKWIARNAIGLAGTFLLEQLIINTIADMYGVDDDDEDKKDWNKVGALPNVTQTLIQGQPIMDTFSSMNIPREVINMFIDTSGDDKDSGMNGLTRFIMKNIVSHVNPIAKSIGEVVTKKDLIDDQIIDTSNKYSAYENLFRKTSAYFLGSSGANAATKALFKSDEDDSLSKVKNAAINAINAELGNTKAQKENRKNYYKALNIINNYLYSDTDNSNNSTGLNFSSAQASNVDYSQYDTVKSTLYKLINEEASDSKVYETINNLINSGYSLQTIRSALRNCSVSGKLSKLNNYNDFIASLTGAELQNLKTALAYENYMYPWLDDNIDQINKYISRSNHYTTNLKYLYRTNYNYNSYQPSSYNIPNSNNNYRKNYSDAFDTYKSFIKQQEYNKKQADYKRRQQQYKENK